MLLKHIINSTVGYEIMKSSLPKIKGDSKMATEFQQVFGLSKQSMYIAGIFEFIGALFLFMSTLGKIGQKLVMIGTLLINIVMGVAIFHHYKAGHGFKGAKAAIKYFFINIISFIEALVTIRKV